MNYFLRRLGTWCSAVLQSQTFRPPPSKKRVPLLIVVEGRHDVEFLRRIGTLLHRHHPQLPNLAHAETAGELSFLPAGGGNLWSWPNQLAALDLPELHILDREVTPVTEQREQLVAAINARRNCRAFLTSKRALENYLHPEAILQAAGIKVEFSDDDSVPLAVALAQHKALADQPPWVELSHRARKRRCERAKRWLNTQAAECMTIEQLAKRDPAGEIAGWIAAAGQLLGPVN